jgi:mediator of RNA polymerase II transcription subunit 12
VDNRTFLSWLVLQMCTCNLAQASFVARLADEYLDGILACRALSKPFVDACLSKISEVQIMMATVINTANRYTDSKFLCQGNPPLS